MSFRFPTIIYISALLICISSAYPHQQENEVADVEAEYIVLKHIYNSENQFLRVRRSPETQEEKDKRVQGWEIRPGAERGNDQNTNAGVEVKRTGEKHDFEAGWNKVVNGPGRAKPTWHVGGTFRFD